MLQQTISKYIYKLRDQHIDKISLITEMLSVLSFGELQNLRKHTPRMFHGLLKVPYLRRKQYADIFTKGRVLRKDCVDIYGALTFVIQNNAESINHYIELKHSLDDATAKKKYDESYKLLKLIDKEISVSMTGKYYLLKLTRLDKGITASTQLHNEICEENNLLSYFSNMSLKSASIDIPFEAEIEGYYQALNGNDDIEDFLTAFSFPYKDLKGDRWLRLLLFTSIIDLYVGFVLQLAKLKPNQLKEGRFVELLQQLGECIHDERIARLLSFVDINACKRIAYLYDEERALLESYYRGRYEEVIFKGVSYLKNHPIQATILDIYIRSCIKLGVVPEDFLPEDSLAYKILELSYWTYASDNISDLARLQLRDICMAWYAIPQLRHLYQIIHDLDMERTGYVYQNFWRYSTPPEIRDASFFITNDEAIEYLINWGYNPHESIQIAILKGEKEDTYNQSVRLIYGYCEDDLSSFREVLIENQIAPLLTGCIASQLFEKMIKAQRYTDAVSLYVGVKLNHPYAGLQINKKYVTQVMTDEEDCKIFNQLELAAFYTMISADVYKRYLAYKRYLKNIGKRRASEIDDISTPLLQYFVGKVAERSVLTLHVREFDTDDDVDAERISLCKKMTVISTDKNYSDEITTLIKEHEVRALSQQVNDSKIHVDVQALINGDFAMESLMFDTYKEIDDNLELFEQRNAEGFKQFLEQKYEGKVFIAAYEQPTVKYKNVLFHQMFLGIRDKFLLDPVYGLDKYLSSRIRHGTLLTQLRNHFLEHSLVTNKIEGGEYQRVNPWSQQQDLRLSESDKERINERLLRFTKWLDNQLRAVKDERIQILTERNDGIKNGLFDYSEQLMSNSIDSLELSSYESFDAFVHASIALLWKWTDSVLEMVRKYFMSYQEMVLAEMTNLQSDMMQIMSSSTSLSNKFKDTITTCKTEFQSDIAVVCSWFKPEQSSVRHFTMQQAVDTSLSVINKINQDALSFFEIRVEDTCIYDGNYFNAFHDIFHDMMNNILGYETKRSAFKGKGKIIVRKAGDILNIEVSNPVDERDIEEIRGILKEQQNFPMLIASGKARKEKNSGCVKIYSTVMYTLGDENKYLNTVEENCFVARLEIDTKGFIYNENIDS